MSFTETQEDQISQFMTITESERDLAIGMLQEASWDPERAVSSYYDGTRTYYTPA
jgi:hypothetical protein